MRLSLVTNKGYLLTYLLTLLYLDSDDERCTRLRRLGINGLELRRLHADLILCYKIIHSYLSLSSDSFFTVVRDHRTLGHSLTLFVPDARVNCKKHFFAVRMEQFT